MIKKIDTSVRISGLIYLAIFVIILVCNILTPYVVDDFYYTFSFATNEPLKSVWDIFPSMAAHTLTMNGRLSAHFLVQLFMLMPRWVFDLVNSAMFCLHIALVDRLFFAKSRSNLRIAAIFAGICLYELSFGQVNLWQDGAVNYLWSGVFMLAFLHPFANRFLNGTDFPKGMWFKIGFLLYSFFEGSFSETASAAAIFIAVLLLVLDVCCNHRKLSKYGLLCIAVAMLGYVSIYLAPAQWINKSAQLSLFVLAKNIANATLMYAKFGVLIAVFVVLLVVAVTEKVPVKRILLALSFAAGSLAANYILIFANYYSERSTVGALLLLMVAVGVLIPPVLEMKQWKSGMVSAMIILILAAIPPFLRGMLDIYITYLDIEWNKTIIQQSIVDGETDVALPIITSDTKYSALYDTVYLLEDSTCWINETMAEYYGVNSISGISVEQ